MGNSHANFNSRQRAAAHRQNQSGFVLLATLFALVAIAILAAYFAQRVAQIRDAAQIEVDAVAAETDFASFRARLAYAANLNVVTARGLEQGATDIVVREAQFNRRRLPLDGSVFSLDSNSKVSVQDLRGLISINYCPEPVLRRFLSVWNIPANQHDALIDSLYDYIDDDDLKRLHGAEQAQYRELGLPPPANTGLITIAELSQIPAWRELLTEFDKKPGAKDAFLAEMTASPQRGINPNSAPRRVIAAIEAFEPKSIDAFLSARSKGEIAQPDNLQPFLRAQTDFDTVALFPSRDWLLQFDRATLPFLLKCSLKLERSSGTQPARTVDCYRQKRSLDVPLKLPGNIVVEPSEIGRLPEFPIDLVRAGI
jgi:type II secretory pathway pseudopilin PulG